MPSCYLDAVDGFVAASERIRAATCPEDVFGATVVDVKLGYRYLLRLVHPDRNGDSLEAKETTEILNRLKSVADERLASGAYGKRLPLPEHEPLVIDGHTVARKPLRGDVADVYLGEREVLKVARSADDNDLMRAERDALAGLFGVKGPVHDGLPKLTGTFQVAGTGGWRRDVNVFERALGFVTAETVHSKLPSLEPRAIVWVFKRLLVLLEWAHHYGFVHGAILPQHLMLYPDNDEGQPHALPGKARFSDPRKHSILLVDWCYAVEHKKRTRLSAWVPSCKRFYPPELVAKESVSPCSDLYMAAAVMVHLAGDVTALPDALHEVLIKCLSRDPSQRYQKAGQAFDDWTAAARQAYGAGKWIDFNLPK